MSWAPLGAVGRVATASMSMAGHVLNRHEALAMYGILNGATVAKFVSRAFSQLFHGRTDYSVTNLRLAVLALQLQ